MSVPHIKKEMEKVSDWDNPYIRRTGAVCSIWPDCMSCLTPKWAGWPEWGCPTRFTQKLDIWMNMLLISLPFCRSVSVSLRGIRLLTNDNAGQRFRRRCFVRAKFEAAEFNLVGRDVSPPPSHRSLLMRICLMDRDEKQYVVQDDHLSFSSTTFCSLRILKFLWWLKSCHGGNQGKIKNAGAAGLRKCYILLS